MEKTPYTVQHGLIKPKPKRGRPQYNEGDLIQEALKGLDKGIFKSARQAAQELKIKANAFSGGDDTKLDRLQRKISKAWKEFK